MLLGYQLFCCWVHFFGKGENSVQPASIWLFHNSLPPFATLWNFVFLSFVLALESTPWQDWDAVLLLYIVFEIICRPFVKVWSGWMGSLRHFIQQCFQFHCLAYFRWGSQSTWVGTVLSAGNGPAMQEWVTKKWTRQERKGAKTHRLPLMEAAESCAQRKKKTNSPK